MDQHGSIDALLAIMARLRDPLNGCPWDLKQTFASIAPYTLEEAYEVAEAIENGDLPELCDELGDLLFQVVFHARMAEEQDAFAFPQVVESICAKMIRRHPHVFAAADLPDVEAVRAHWEVEKAAERAHKGRHREGVLAGVAPALPALVRAQKLQRRAAGVGFDWDHIDGVFDKVREELDECRATLDEPAGSAKQVHEIGDLLFSCVNLARHLGVDAEQALRVANQRFAGRFGKVESRLRARGLEPGPGTREDMEREWALAKAEEGKCAD